MINLQDSPFNKELLAAVPTIPDERRLKLLEIGAQLYPTFNGATLDELKALDDLRIMSELNYTYFNMASQSQVWAERVPEILKLVVDIITCCTGMTVYSFAIWDDLGKRTLIHDVISDTVTNFMDSEEAETVRQKITAVVLNETGPSFTRDWEKAFPTIYGMPRDCFRPRMPPFNPRWQEECYQLMNYFPTEATWQGHYGKFSMQALNDDIQSRTFKLVEEKRIPPGVTHVPVLYSDWTEETTRIWSSWFRTHQLRMDSGDVTAEQTIFQLSAIKDKDGHMQPRTTYQRDIAEECELEYNQSTAFYYAAWRATSRVLCTEGRGNSIEELARRDENLHRLYKLCVRYERYLAPEGPLRHPNAPRCYHLTKTDKKSLDKIILSPCFPAEFYGYHAQSNPKWDVRAFAKHVQEGGALDSVTNEMPRGRNGAFRYFMTLLRFYISVNTPFEHGDLNSDDFMEYGPNEQPFVHKAIRCLIDQLESSMGKLVDTEGELPLCKMAWDDPWDPKKMLWWDKDVEIPLKWRFVRGAIETLDAPLAEREKGEMKDEKVVEKKTTKEQEEAEQKQMTKAKTVSPAKDASFKEKASMGQVEKAISVTKLKQTLPKETHAREGSPETIQFPSDSASEELPEESQVKITRPRNQKDSDSDAGEGPILSSLSLAQCVGPQLSTNADDPIIQTSQSPIGEELEGATEHLRGRPLLREPATLGTNKAGDPTSSRSLSKSSPATRASSNSSADKRSLLGRASPGGAAGASGPRVASGPPFNSPVLNPAVDNRTMLQKALDKRAKEAGSVALLDEAPAALSSSSASGSNRPADSSAAGSVRVPSVTPGAGSPSAAPRNTRTKSTKRKRDFAGLEAEGERKSKSRSVSGASE